MWEREWHQLAYVITYIYKYIYRVKMYSFYLHLYVSKQNTKITKMLHPSDYRCAIY